MGTDTIEATYEGDGNFYDSSLSSSYGTLSQTVNKDTTGTTLALNDAVVEKLLDVLYAGFVLPTTTTTVLHDWSKGRRSEVDDINGAVVALLGPEAAPVNAAVVEMAHRIERGDLDPKLSNYAELAALAGLA